MSYIDIVDQVNNDSPDVNNTKPSSHDKGVLLSSAGLATVSAAFLAGCGGGGDAASNTIASAAGSSSSQEGSVGGSSLSQSGGNQSTVVTDSQAARFLLQAQFSASEPDIAAVKSLGYDAWLEQQFKAGGGQSACDWVIQKGYNVESKRFDRSVVDNMMWAQLIKSPDAFRQRVALALSEIFVISINADVGNPFGFTVGAYWDMLLDNAFGNFRVLLEKVTLSPAMGYYLNMKGNQKANSVTGRQPDENYAREVMQLFSIGLNQLNIDGKLKRDEAGNPIPTYNQEDVVNLAKVFTGWDLDPSASFDIANPMNVKVPMTLFAVRHSTEEAKFLGVTVPTNTDGKVALKIALDTLSNHPNVAPFICRQLIQRLVTSNPSPEYVGRVAAVFNKDAENQRGNLKSVIKAILLDDEARNDQSISMSTFGKVREPMIRFIQWAKTFNALPANDNWALNDLSNSSNSLGQSPLRSPSVFNFFRPGYVPPNTALGKAGLTVPEFQIVNEVTVTGYTNFMQTAVSNGGNLKADYSGEMTLITNPAALVKRLALLISGNQLLPSTQTAIQDAIATIDVSTQSERNNRLYCALTLVFSNPEYIVQK
jgi:uncharacterized protein (DUF1800 family)